MPSEIDRTIPASGPELMEAFLNMDQKNVFADKRVVPPLRQPETRIAGTLHLPGAELKAGRS